MAKSVKRNVESDENQLVLIHRNQHNLFWHSTLFNEVYLQNDVPVFHTDVWIDDEVPFEQFLTQFQNYVETLEGENPNTWSERTTINRIIKPILEMLGYTSVSNDRVEPWLEDEAFSVQEADGLKTYKPDFIIVNDHKELKYIQNEKKSEKKIAEARNSVILPIEAKYWGRIDEYRQNQKEDTKRADKKSNGDGSRVMDFDEQCLKYMEILNKQYGILTDGKTWRLYNLSFSSPNYKPYFQFNLGHMIKHVQNSDFLKSNGDYELFKEEVKYFYFLFRKKALFSENGQELFVDELLNYSKKYVVRVEEDLKNRFVNAMTIACNGFQRAVVNGGERADIDLIRSVSESHIFNILFLKYCEARNILPIKQDPEGYRKISISNVLDRLERFDPNKELDNLNYPLLKRMFADISYNPSGHHLYERLLKLTKIVQDGTSEEFKGFIIKGFKESIYSKDEWRFAQKFKLSNKEMIQILFELGYSESDIQGRKYQQIPYNSFSPRQLGSIYESFLEFKLEKASEEMIFQKKQWVSANLKSEKVKAMDVPKVSKGELFFTPNNEERKATGSYYTPDWVVQHIIHETINPLLEKKSSSEILNVRVCDPAMGSAHFLSATLNYLARRYLEKLGTELNDDVTETMLSVKRRVLHNCIFGVDINPRAVKLAKMSLWLESADPYEALEDLDDQIKCANSISDENVWKNNLKFLSKGVDAVVGNPPYLAEKGQKELFQRLATGWLGKKYYAGKMDLFYFFYHLGIEILKQDGRLGFITTSYWPTADAAAKLRTHIRETTSLEQMIFTGALKIFKDAPGQSNLITIFQKTKLPKKDFSLLVFPTEMKNVTFENSESLFNNELSKSSDSCKKSIPMSFLQKEVWPMEQSVAVATTKQTKALDGLSLTIENFLEINEGLHSGADKVTKKHIRLFKELKSYSGNGVMILDQNEALKICKTKEEKSVLIPFVKNSDIEKFKVTANPENLFVIYIDGKNSFKNMPNIKEHLETFKDVLKLKRGFQKGTHEWYQLHWPRTRELFENPKILVPYRAETNRFAIDKNGFSGSADVFFLSPKKDCKYSLEFLTGWLNSSIAENWCLSNLKKKGKMREYKPTILRNLPVPNIDMSNKEMLKVYTEVEGIVRQSANGKIEPTDAVAKLDALFSNLLDVSKGSSKKAA